MAADQRPAADERDTPAEAPADRAVRLAALRRLDAICKRACDAVDARLAAEAADAPTPGDTTPAVGEPPPAA